MYWLGNNILLDTYATKILHAQSHAGGGKGFGVCQTKMDGNIYGFEIIYYIAVITANPFAFHCQMRDIVEHNKTGILTRSIKHGHPYNQIL